MEKLTGNKNNLTITITAVYTDGAKQVFSKTYSINNNAEDVYELNGFLVYVNTKGNVKIFGIDIINL